MPEFIDLLQKNIAPRKRELKERIIIGREKALTEERFNELFQANYFPLNSIPAPKKLTFIAIDGSQGIRVLANGYIFYVTRALGISNTLSKEQHLISDIFSFSTGRHKKSTYVGLKSEFCEFQVIHQILQKIKNHEIPTNQESLPVHVILLDGSFYGRLMHLPIETNVINDGDFSLKYLAIYAQIIALAKETNTLLVGVSKDSNANFFRNEILDTILDEEMSHLKTILTKPDIGFLHKLVEAVDELNPRVYDQYLKLKERFPSQLLRFDEILEEYFHNQTDHSLILQYALRGGFTRPMELGPARQRPIVIFNQLVRDPTGYLHRRFRSVLIEKQKEGKLTEFTTWAREIIEKYLNMPTIVSFHFLPRLGDSPMRIDVPSYVFGSHNILKVFMRTDFLPDTSLDVAREILSFLMDQYVDLETYNIYLKTVDQEVKLSRETLDLYEQAITNELDVLIHHTRDYRRVKFP